MSRKQPPTKPPAVKRGPRIDYAKFVDVWTRASSVREVATAIGCTIAHAYAVARKLRDKGVHLKQFTRRGDINSDELNRIIEQARSKA